MAGGAKSPEVKGVEHRENPVLGKTPTNTVRNPEKGTQMVKKKKQKNKTPKRRRKK